MIEPAPKHNLPGSGQSWPSHSSPGAGGQLRSLKASSALCLTSSASPLPLQASVSLFVGDGY